MKKEKISLPKALVAKQEKTEEWVDEEKSLEDEEPKAKCLIAPIDDSHTEESNGSSSTFDVDLYQAARESKMQEWDSSSMYQIKKFVNYSSNEKFYMFDYLCLDLAKSNSKKLIFKSEIKVSKEKFIATEIFSHS